jgi:hypothetical protein
MMKEVANKIDFFKELVRKHKVCWESWPEFYLDTNGRKIQIGFELDLVGTHDNPAHFPSPGCDECEKVYDALRQIALWIIPDENHLSRYDIQIFDDALRYAKIRNFRPDVTLILKILHKAEFDQPVDECEVSCLKEMEEKLRKLGASKRKWRSSGQDADEFHCESG